LTVPFWRRWGKGSGGVGSGGPGSGHSVPGRGEYETRARRAELKGQLFVKGGGGGALDCLLGRGGAGSQRVERGFAPALFALKQE